jgi:hypothetical protein
MPALSLNVPGVYLRVVEPVVPPPLAGVAGFVGQAERGPLNAPQLVTRWGEFLDIFGGFTGYSYLAYAVFAFFHTGGERCRVVRVAHETSTHAATMLLDDTGTAVLEIRASGPGVWGRAIEVAIDPRSTTDMVLTETAADAGVGATDVAFRSVAGMSSGDEVSLVDSRDSRLREDRLPVLAIDRLSGRVTFSRAMARALPAGTPVIGRGWRLRVRAAGAAEGSREEVFDQLSMSRNHPRYVGRAINGNPQAREFLTRMREGTSILVDVVELSPIVTDRASRPLTATTQLQGGDDGPLALESAYYTGRTASAYFRPVRAGADLSERLRAQQTLFGLAGFEAVNDLEMVAIPDLPLPDVYRDAPAVPPEGVVFARGLPSSLAWSELQTGQREILEHCARMGDRLALLDAPPGAAIDGGTTRIDQWPAQIAFQDAARSGALYYPWVRQRPVDFGGRDLFVPPCGHVAGVYAAAARRGVGKPPANEPMPGVVQFEIAVTDAMQEVLNPRGVNCLRVMPGRGPRVWGARTLSDDPHHRYVNVRRVTLLVVRQILSALQWTVFEAHDSRLRGRIAASLTVLMTGLLRSGSLAGSRPDESFFVQCDEETTPPDAVDRGELIARVGFVPAGATEFVVVTIQRTPGTLAVAELEETR